MSGFRKFVSVLSASLCALGSSSAHGNVKVDDGNFQVNVEDVSKVAGKKAKKKANKGGVDKNLRGAKPSGKTKSGAGFSDDSKLSENFEVDNELREILDNLPEDSPFRTIATARVVNGKEIESHKNLVGLLNYSDKKSKESLMRGENIWRAILVPTLGKYGSDSEDIIMSRGIVEMMSDGEFVQALKSFIKNPEDGAEYMGQIFDRLINSDFVSSTGDFAVSICAYVFAYCLFLVGFTYGFSDENSISDLVKYFAIGISAAWASLCLSDVAFNRRFKYSRLKNRGKMRVLDQIAAAGLELLKMRFKDEKVQK